MTLKPVAPTSVAPLKIRKQVPTIRKITSAATLMSANQNSISPKSLTLTRLSESTTTRAIKAIVHCGTCCSGCQYCAQNFTYRAAAVTSTMEVIAQLRKYIHPAPYASFSP
jgi:hypothetical protein